MRLRLPALLVAFAFSVPLAPAAELTLADVANVKGDGPDGKGNTADDAWQFWFELAHKPGHFEPLSTYSTSVAKEGVKKKITGPIASMLPNPDDTEGWIFHRDWDGRFEGVWADKKAKQIIAYPYVEKTFHGAVAVTWRVPADGAYDVSGGLTDLQVAPQFKQHDGVDWIVETAEGGKPVKKFASGGPIGDGNDRPDSGKFEAKGVEAKKGQSIRLVVHPRKWWGSDMTRIDALKIEPAKKVEAGAEESACEGDDEELKKLEKRRCPRPKRLGLVFSFGYGGDTMPKDDAKFDELLVKIKEGGFNVIHCTYTDKRLEQCKKRGVQMMIDLLSEADHHVYKSPEKAEAVCKKVKGDPGVWGYNIWNDLIRKTGPGRMRDVLNVRKWDPTHPAFVGTYQTDGMSKVQHADLIGYYDYHWSRGPHKHFPHIVAFSGWAAQRNAWWGSWLAAKSGLPGKGNFNRSLWSATTSIACGQRCILWFLATEMMNKDTLEWTEIGRDIHKVHKEIAPLAEEIARLDMPTAIWSTPITKTANNDPLPDGKKEMLPGGLEQKAIPKDAWCQVAKGEVLIGAYEGNKTRSLFVANHNAYVEQAVELKFAAGTKVALFDRAKKSWRSLEAKDGAVSFVMSPGGGELLRIEQGK